MPLIARRADALDILVATVVVSCLPHIRLMRDVRLEVDRILSPHPHDPWKDFDRIPKHHAAVAVYPVTSETLAGETLAHSVCAEHAKVVPGCLVALVMAIRGHVEVHRVDVSRYVLCRVPGFSTSVGVDAFN